MTTLNDALATVFVLIAVAGACLVSYAMTGGPDA